MDLIDLLEKVRDVLRYQTITLDSGHRAGQELIAELERYIYGAANPEMWITEGDPSCRPPSETDRSFNYEDDARDHAESFEPPLDIFELLRGRKLEPR